MIDDYNKQHLKYLNLNAIVGEFERKNKFSGLNAVSYTHLDHTENLVN